MQVTDKDMAKIAAFEKSVGIRSITLEGDTYDPSGQLTGGSRPRSSGILNHISEFQHLQQQASSAEVELSEIEKKLSELSCTRERYNNLKSSLELDSHEYDIMSRTLFNSSTSKFMEETNKLESKLSDLESQGTSLTQQKADLLKECDKIEKDIKEYSELGPAKLRELSVSRVVHEHLELQLISRCMNLFCNVYFLLLFSKAKI